MIKPEKARLEKIHAASMAILAKTGVRLHSPRALEFFARAGQRTDGDLVYPSEDFLMKTLALAPPEFTLEARNHK